ncbi:MAG: oxidoreductase [Acidimicrobiales bacterium]
MAKWTIDDAPDQTSRTVVITGANSGLGLRSAEALASRGARVLLACRNPEKGAAALEAVSLKATDAPPELVTLDLADLESVKDCARQLDASLDGLDVLINNAGVMAIPLRRTRQGFEMQFGTNHFGHFALTGLLLATLLRTDRPRVVTVSSFAHRFGKIRFDDPNWEQGRYSPWPAYGQSKLANLLFSMELSRRAQDAGSALVSAAAHPGYAATNLSSSGPGASGGLMARATRISDRVFGQSDSMGALPQIYAATMPDVQGNDYYGPDGFMEQRGFPKKIGRTRAGADADAARRLWELSEQMTGVTCDFGR